MDFGWALGAMRNGETVRRRAWLTLVQEPREYRSVRLEQPGPDWEDVLVVTTWGGLKTMYNASHAQLLADDWELD